MLLCLFRGLLASADFHQRPEALHFGFHLDGNEPYKLIKKKRGPDGKELDKLFVQVPMRSAERQVVDVNGLRDQMKATFGISFEPSLASAEFAFQMTEGVQKIQFNQ